MCGACLLCFALHPLLLAFSSDDFLYPSCAVYRSVCNVGASPEYNAAAEYDVHRQMSVAVFRIHIFQIVQEEEVESYGCYGIEQGQYD